MPVLTGHHPRVLGFAHEGDHVLEAVHGLMDGIAAERPEAPCDFVERLRRQPLAAHGDHMIVIENPAQLLERVVVRVAPKLDAAHLGAERAGERKNFESLETLVAQHGIS